LHTQLPGRLRCVLALFLGLLSGASLAFARNASPPQSSQSAKKDYALIYGTVWGPDDHPVAGVPIKIRVASEKKMRWELLSDRYGEFAQRVPAGTQDYIIQADIKTPKGQPKPETTAHIDNNERTDVSLHLKETLSSR
jgi:hypothetical protein